MLFIVLIREGTGSDLRKSDSYPFHSEFVSTQRTATILLGEQACRIAIQWRFDAPPSFGPVLCQGRVVDRRVTFNTNVPNDLGPSKFHQVDTADSVTKYSVVIPELAEIAEVPGRNSPL